MNIDENKGVYQCAFQKEGGDYWSSSRGSIVVIATDFEHAKALAEEYAEKEKREAPVIKPGDDASLNKKDDIPQHIGEIKLLFTKIIY
jgi:hypothetical protein